MRGVFVDANESLAVIFDRLRKSGDPDMRVHRDPDITPEQYPALLDGAGIAVVDHTALPTAIAKQCKGLKDVVFLGTGARSYMNPEELAGLGISVHLIKGYGDTAVAESAIALMWSSARVIAMMDREMRAGNWLREDGMQLTGKTLGLIGFGGIAAEVARIALGSGMRVIAWNRSPKNHPGVGRMSIQMTDEDVQGIQQHVEAQRQEAERHEALKAQERHIETQLTIPTGPPIDSTKPAELFNDRDEMVRHMRDERYKNDPKFRTWVEARVIASDF